MVFAPRLHEHGRQQHEGVKGISTLPHSFAAMAVPAIRSVRPSRLAGGGGGLTLPADGARSDGIELPLLLHHPPSDGGEGAKNDHRTQGFLSSHAALNLEHFSHANFSSTHLSVGHFDIDHCGQNSNSTVLSVTLRLPPQKFEMLFRISLQ